MGYILIILIIGLSGIVAQVLILRELLVNFYGNELTIGIVLANWLALEALGVFIVGKISEKVKNKINLFIFLQIIFSLALPASIYFARTFKYILNIPQGEGVGLFTIFSASFFILLPLAFCHGALFSSIIKLFSLKTSESEQSIARVYSWETIGTILGGLILTYFFIPALNSFQIVFIISIFNLIICLPLIFYKRTVFKYIIILSITLLTAVGLRGGIVFLNKISINKQWNGQKVIDYRNSIYGNIAVIQKEKQLTFFYNGIPIVSTPYPDITFVQEFGNLPLLFHPRPKNILVISAGAGGLINEILKHPGTKIDYTELDPLIIKMLKLHASDLIRRELSDNRLNFANIDGRRFIRTTLKQYDVILIGLSNPSDLSINRLFSEEFFTSVKRRMQPEGILALWLPGSLTYLSQELKDINASVLNGLKNTYAYVRIIPGDYNIFLASPSSNLLEVSPELISQRIGQRKLKIDILLPGYLKYRLNQRWLDWFNQQMGNATSKINQDFQPIAVFKTLLIWNKQFSPAIAKILNSLEKLNLGGILILVLILTFILLFIILAKFSKQRLKISVGYGIATTGLFSMLINLVLIFSFQVLYGYLYHQIGLLISIFMAGIATAAFILARQLKKITNPLKLFIRIETLIFLYPLFIAIIIDQFKHQLTNLPLFFTLLFFILGLLTGLEFPLAAKLYLQRGLLKTRVFEK